MRVSLPAKAVRRAPDARLLASWLDEIVAEAWSRRHGAWSATTALNDARSRTGVREATRELSLLAEALRETPDIDSETLRLCRDLLCDGFASPLYGGDDEALRRGAGRLRYRVLAGDADV